MYIENKRHIYLVHHGIDGQKWGVRNGPPYPLNHNHNSKTKIEGKTYSVKSMMSGSSDFSKVTSDVNKLNVMEKKNSCVQTSLAVYFTSIGKNKTAVADVDKNGYGKEHNLVFECCSIFPELENGKFTKNIRDFSDDINGYTSSKDKLSNKLIEWYGNNASGVIAMNIINHKNKVVGHAFNFKIKNGKIEYHDELSDIDFNFSNRPQRSMLQAVRLDNLTEINQYELNKMCRDL